MPHFAITQRVVSKHHRSLKCRKLTATGSIFWNAFVISKYVFIFKRRTVLIGPCSWSNRKGWLYHGGSTFIECRWGWSNLPVLNHRRFNLHCHAINVLKKTARWINVLSIITWKSLLFWLVSFSDSWLPNWNFCLVYAAGLSEPVLHYYTVYSADPI